ncbi:hypothetical protein diail_1335 [Diaporthe ilicicola]|nr:hypothetical protein diail_1335 [Diaporthe ilicicola]
MILSLLLGSTLAYLIWSIICLERNVRKVRALNIHAIRIPFDVNNYVWVFSQPLLWKLLAYLPIPWSSYPDFVRFSHRNWHFLEKSSPAARFDSAWATVSPSGFHIYVADADAIQDICSRWRDFFRPIEMYQMLSVYGPSVFTTGLQDWPRHRRAVAAPFNESIMKFVWDESLRHANAMTTYWESRSKAGIPGMQEDLQTFTLNVLASAAFRESYDFRGSAQSRKADSNIESYRDALFIVHKHAIYLMLIPFRVLTGPMMPKDLAKIGRAAVYLKDYMMNMVRNERAALDRGEPGSGGLITQLVRDQKATQATDSVAAAKSGRGALSTDEILGNLFVINFAGYDTTAITLSFAMMLLAANPDVQEWLSQEIIAVTQDRPVEDWTYELFPKLNRCRAVLLETLRLYGPITGLPKVSSDRVQHLRVGDRVLAIPPRTETIPMIHGVQTDPRYWPGGDPHVWRPSRWVVCPEAAVEPTREELLVPRRGSYLPWADGAQGCAGKKFSQVEAVAALACIFRTCRIRPKEVPGETSEQAEERTRNCVNDVNYQLMLRMNHPDRVKLECVKVQMSSNLTTI